MGTLYKETVGYKRQKGIRIVLFLGFVILSINTVILISSLRNIFEEFLLVSYILIPLAAIGMAYSWVKGNRRYKYLIIDRELIIEKLSGNKRKPVLNINTKRIVRIEKYESRKPSEKLYKQYSFLCSGNKSSAYNCIYEMKGKLYGFYFEPSTELYNKIIRLRNYSKTA